MTHNTQIDNAHVKKIQDFVHFMLDNDKVTPMYASLKLHHHEMVSLDGGLPKLFQQALLIDCIRGSNIVWDCGFSIRKDESALTGYRVDYTEPTSAASNAALLSLLYNSADILERLTPEPKTIELDIAPIRPQPEKRETLQDQFSWPDFEPFIMEKEANYRADQVQQMQL